MNVLAVRAMTSVATKSGSLMHVCAVFFFGTRVLGMEVYGPRGVGLNTIPGIFQSGGVIGGCESDTSTVNLWD